MGSEAKEKYKKKFRNCEQNFKEKLFLASFDLMTLNISSRILFQVYIFFDFLFLLYYPLNKLFNKSKSSINTSSNKLFDFLK